MRSVENFEGRRNNEEGRRKKKEEGRRKKEEGRRERGRFRIIDDLGGATICKLACGRSANLPVAKLPNLVIISHCNYKI
ncbi:hypothetical protein [Microcoleus asticus]|uniref:hypothetical protein n=1 Tax=Microcoleus asticus TaxID=2815231 RepID=UPI001552103E|nr:hypothetical protein [Microcoleus asticus]